MTPKLKTIVSLKVFLGAILSVFLYYSLQAAKTAEPQNEVKTEKARKSKSSKNAKPEPQVDQSENPESVKVPEIPKGDIGLNEALKVREQLEFLRQDVLTKISKLQSAKQAYDRSKADVETKQKKIDESQKLLDETLQHEKKAKEERLTDALAFMGKMEPKKAAPMLETMDRDLVILLLRKLQPTQVTKILEATSPKKAAEYMEYYTKIRSGREYELMKELGLCLAETPGQSEKSLFGEPTKATDGAKTVAEVQATATPDAAVATATPSVEATQAK